MGPAPDPRCETGRNPPPSLGLVEGARLSFTAGGGQSDAGASNRWCS